MYGLSFMIRKGGQKKFFEYTLEKANPNKIQQKLQEIIAERPILHETYDQIHLIHHNNLNTLIPQQFFDPKKIRLILQQNVRLLETDQVSYNFLDAHHIFNIYVPYPEIANYFMSPSQPVKNWHSAGYFLQQIEELKRNQARLPIFEIFVNIFPSDFQIAVYQNDQLIAYNHFDYINTEEFLYYFFFMLETLKIKEPQSQISILGQSSEHEVIHELKDFTNKLQIIPGKNPSQINNYF